ncbi:MAG: hypothetical protein U9P14_09815, partial [Gemmatimonadota bacterium]|nr:hypothetical protein [Gemmatimonadota bacterium]
IIYPWRSSQDQLKQDRLKAIPGMKSNGIRLLNCGNQFILIVFGSKKTFSSMIKLNGREEKKGGKYGVIEPRALSLAS